MPYRLEQAPGAHDGYYVETEATGRRHSKKPLSKHMATRQMRALYTHAPDAKGSARPRDRNTGSRAREVHFDTEGMTRSINNINNRLVQTGNPLRPTQDFTNLYSASAVVTEFPRRR